MSFPGFQWRRAGWLAGLVLTVAAAQPAAAQSTEAKPADPAKAENGRPDAGARRNEIAEAARVVIGPAGNPECVWLGRRVVGLLWRDDLDTAMRHLDLYDRFGCPGAHIQASFRCVIRSGNLDPKAQESLNNRVHGCWINPSMVPPPVATPTVQSSPATSSGTTTR